jgi:hypothetical protein
MGDERMRDQERFADATAAAADSASITPPALRPTSVLDVNRASSLHSVAP